MTTAFTRSQLRESNRRCVRTIESASMTIDGAINELESIRIAVAATSGGSAAALITSTLASWRSMKSTFDSLVANSESLMNSQMGQGNRDD